GTGMTGSSAPSFDSVESVLRDSGTGTDAAEVHGTLCGLMCMLGPAARPSWIAGAVDRTDQSSTHATMDLLDALAAGLWRTLEERNMGFRPLLPDDEEPLGVRADSLARWCQGFNHGLATGANAADAADALGVGMTGEIVQDFGEMARGGYGTDETEAEAESAYAELVEYVRVSVQLVFEEF